MAAKGKGKAQQGGNVMIILVGLPGCTPSFLNNCLFDVTNTPFAAGKSTVAIELQSFGFTRVNQDELGSAEECKKAIAKALKHGEHVVLDRCNTMQKERKMFITETKREFENLKFVEAVHLDPADDGDGVIDSFLKGFKPPEKWEGYQELFTIRNSDDLKTFYLSIKERYPKPEKKGASSSGKPDPKKKK